MSENNVPHEPIPKAFTEWLEPSPSANDLMSQFIALNPEAVLEDLGTFDSIEGKYDLLPDQDEVVSHLDDVAETDEILGALTATNSTMLTPRKYQQTGINWLFSHRRAALLDDPGLGKTLQAAEAAISPTLIIAPSHLTHQWWAFLHTQFPDQMAVVADGPTKERLMVCQAAVAMHIPWLIINKEMCQVETPTTRANKLRKAKQTQRQQDYLFSTGAADSDIPEVRDQVARAMEARGPRILTDYIKILRGNFNTIIIDEAHHFKTRTSKQAHGAHILATTPRPAAQELVALYRAAYPNGAAEDIQPPTPFSVPSQSDADSQEIPVEFDVPSNDLIDDLSERQAAREGKKTVKSIDIKKLPNVYLLTATPVKRESDDWYMLMHLLDPSRFKSYHNFTRDYCVTDYGNSWRASVYGAQANLKDLVSEYAIRRVYEDPEVEIELPDIIPVDPIVVVPSGRVSELIRLSTATYRDFAPDVLAEMPITSATKLVTSLRAINATDENKVAALKEELENLPIDRPALIYVWYKSTAGFLLHQVGRDKAEIISGEDNAKVRTARVEAAFKSGKHVIATIASLSEGVNISEYVDNVFFYEEEYSYGTMYQALSRLRRFTPGQEHRIKRIIYFHLKDTIDEAIHRTWMRREKSALDVLKHLGRGHA